MVSRVGRSGPQPSFFPVITTLLSVHMSLCLLGFILFVHFLGYMAHMSEITWFFGEWQTMLWKVLFG